MTSLRMTTLMERKYFLVLDRDCLGQVDQGQEHENVGLDQGDSEVQAEEDDWNSQRHHGEEDQGQQVAGKHVRVKTDGERHDAGEVRDDLDGKEQRSDPPDGPGKVLDVSPETLGADAVPVVVEEGQQGDAEGHDGVGGGGLNAREKS